MPPTRTDRARVIFWLQLASLIATGWIVSRIPFLMLGFGRFLPGALILAAGYCIAALVISGLITFLLLRAVRRIERAEVLGVTLRTCAAGVWFAPAVILSGSSSLATIASLALVVTATRVLYSQWRPVPKAEVIAPASERVLGSGSLPGGFLPRDFWPAFAIAATLQAGLASTIVDKPTAASPFYAFAAAVLTAYGISAGVWERQRKAVLPGAIMAVAVTLVLTVVITLLGTLSLMTGRGSGGNAGSGSSDSNMAQAHPPPPPPPLLPSASHRKYNPPPVDPSRLGPTMNVPGGFPGVILWPETEPVTMLVEPLPKGDALAHRPPSQPFVIPFSGSYWMFRWPFQRPPANSFVRRGTPSDASFSTVDRWPLAMEAHQKLDRAIDLNCCSAVRIVIQNADPYNRTVSIVLGLMYHDGRLVRLGPRPVTSIPDTSHDPVVPVVETLEFPVPAPSTVFDEFDVIYQRDKIREHKSARISIEKFILVPR